LFGRRSEKTGDPDQLQLALEDIEQALAAGDAAAEKSNATLQASRSRSRRVNRGALPVTYEVLCRGQEGGTPRGVDEARQMEHPRCRKLRRSRVYPLRSR
jgi:hypothetical protein